MVADRGVEVSCCPSTEDKDTFLLEQARQISEDTQDDRISGVLDLQFAAREEPMSIPYLLGDDYPTEPVHGCFHDIPLYGNIYCQLTNVNGKWPYNAG